MRLRLLCLLLLAFISTSYAAGFKSKLHHVESVRRRLMRENRFDEVERLLSLRKKIRTEHHNSRLARKSSKRPLRDRFDSEYLGAVSVGTPSQTFFVIMDTGSSNFWIADSQCSQKPFLCQRYCTDSEYCKAFAHKLCCYDNSMIGKTVDTCLGMTEFDSSKSSTFNTTDNLFYVAYGTGECYGTVSSDVVKFGQASDADSLSVTAKFGQTTFMGSFFYQSSINGIMGLAFESIAEAKMKPPFIKAYEDGLVDSLFTVYLQHKGYEDINNGGQITLGAIESELCDKSTLFWIPLTSATYWQFHLTSMTFNGAVIPFDGADSISDTGTSYLVIPSTVFQPIYEQISQMKPQRSPSLLSLDCNTKLTLDLMINGKQFRLTEKHLLIQESKGSTDCWVTIDEGENESLWILGDPFIRAYCNVYDYGNTRLGLMTPKSPS